MKSPWFKRIGLIMKPVTIPGWLILFAFFGYLVWSFIQIDRLSHSVSDTLINFAFRIVLAGLAYTLLANLTLLFVRKT